MQFVGFATFYFLLLNVGLKWPLSTFQLFLRVCVCVTEFSCCFVWGGKLMNSANKMHKGALPLSSVNKSHYGTKFFFGCFFKKKKGGGGYSRYFIFSALFKQEVIQRLRARCISFSARIPVMNLIQESRIYVCLSHQFARVRVVLCIVLKM